MTDIEKMTERRDFYHKLWCEEVRRANAAENLLADAAEHLRGLADILGPCERFDHHGNCQTHFIESPCRVGKAREFLESLATKEAK